MTLNSLYWHTLNPSCFTRYIEIKLTKHSQLFSNAKVNILYFTKTTVQIPNENHSFFFSSLDKGEHGATVWVAWHEYRKSSITWTDRDTTHTDKLKGYEYDKIQIIFTGLVFKITGKTHIHPLNDSCPSLVCPVKMHVYIVTKFKWFSPNMR